MTDRRTSAAERPRRRSRRSTSASACRTTRRSRCVDYDPAWPALFEREEARIRGGPRRRGRPRSSTPARRPCPGLAAKPIIDITLIVADSSTSRRTCRDLEAAGYVAPDPRARDWYEHRVFKGPDTNINLHVFSAGSPELDRMVGFRDWLRTHDDDRDAVRADEARARRRGPGGTSRTTPTPRRRSSRRSSRGQACRAPSLSRGDASSLLGGPCDRHGGDCLLDRLPGGPDRLDTAPVNRDRASRDGAGRHGVCIARTGDRGKAVGGARDSSR